MKMHIFFFGRYFHYKMHIVEQNDAYCF